MNRRSLPAGARQKGLEPLTYGLEGRCSIHLSYWREPDRECQRSGREDLNLRPPAPKAGALPGCATPRRSSHLTRRPALIEPTWRAPYAGVVPSGPRRFKENVGTTALDGCARP